jgi:hypothetical protein
MWKMPFRKRRPQARAARELERVRGAHALGDRDVLLKVGRALTDGEFTLETIADSMEVPGPALAAALERVFGVVPAPPPTPQDRQRRAAIAAADRTGAERSARSPG